MLCYWACSRPVGRLTSEEWLSDSDIGIYSFVYEFDAAGNRSLLTKDGAPRPQGLRPGLGGAAARRRWPFGPHDARRTASPRRRGALNTYSARRVVRSGGPRQAVRSGEPEVRNNLAHVTRLQTEIEVATLV